MAVVTLLPSPVSVRLYRGGAPHFGNMIQHNNNISVYERPRPDGPDQPVSTAADRARSGSKL